MEEMVAFLKKLMDQIDEKAHRCGLENVCIDFHYNNGYGSEIIQCTDSDPDVPASEYEPHWRFYHSRMHGGAWEDKTERMNAPDDDKDEDEA